MSEDHFLPPHGNYTELLSYQKAEVIYDLTFRFCHRFLAKGDRTVDQMVQAARSGKQNIVEGSRASVTSKETEIKLTNVARASLEELLNDYRDFLRVRDLKLWHKDSREARYVRRLSNGTHVTYGTYREFCETRPAEVVANIAICLIHQTNYLLDQQIRRLEKDFVQEGGLRERMTRARLEHRDKSHRSHESHKSDDSAQPRGTSRRDAIRRGLMGIAASVLASRSGGLLGAEQPKLPAKPKTRSVIQVFLWGGMSHNDTWDPKPDSGREYTGEFAKAIPTNVPGMQIGELFPLLAKQADKFSLIRSMTHRNNGHETAAYLMQTGHTPGERLSYPSIGAVFALMKGPQYQGLIPPYVVLTRAQGRFSEEGFLGPRYKPFATGGDPNAWRFEVEGIVARGITDDRQKARRQLLEKLNTMGRAMAASPQLAAAEEAKKTAYELILGEGKNVFDLAKEKTELRDRYGRHTFGQDCLVARRLVESGVPYVVINYPGGWDTHSNHFATMRRQCPQLDQGLAALLADLHDRGLLESTLVWCCGEFGRTPKVDWQPPWNGGRNHYGNVFSVLVAGGGFKGGRVVGSSDAKAEEVKERPVYPVDLLGSIYHLAGIDARARLPHPLGLDARVLPSEGVKSAGLLREIM